MAAIQPAQDMESFKPTAIVIDVETTGLIKNNSIRATSKNVAEFPDNFPRIVQLCYMLIDNEGNYYGEVFYVKQREPIPKEAIKIHGITNEKCEKDGDELTDVLKELSVAAEKVDNIVGHNVAFDYKVLHAEYLRAGVAFPLLQKNKIDTMRLTGKALGYKPGYKISLYNSADTLFGKQELWQEFKSKLTQHDAEGDVFVTAIIYNMLNDYKR